MARFPKGDPALIQTIIATLHDPPLASGVDFARFPEATWLRSEPWLDTSGLALYLLQRIFQLGLEAAIPRGVLKRLEEKQRRNTQRTGQMLREWKELNDAFHLAGLRYVNLKGFTLSPESCQSSALRVQSDFDFLIDPRHMDAATSLLLARGYEPSGANARSAEFKPKRRGYNSLESQYSITCRASVELHTTVEGSPHAARGGQCDPRIERPGVWQHRGDVFAALLPEDNFIYQALHLLGHLRHEHTKPSWLLEFRNHARARAHDAAFWVKVQDRAAEHPAAPLALGLSVLLASRLLGDVFPASFSSWARGQLDPRVLLWASCYGERSVLADVPGTKLHLFLEEAISGGQAPAKNPHVMLRLLPARLRPYRSVRTMWYRFLFHCQQDLFYLRERAHWRRLVKLLRESEGGVIRVTRADDTR